MSIKQRTNETYTKAKRVGSNFEQLLQATALLTLAVFSYYALRQLHLNEALEIFITGALVVIGLRGAVEFIKFLDR